MGAGGRKPLEPLMSIYAIDFENSVERMRTRVPTSSHSFDVCDAVLSLVFNPELTYLGACLPLKGFCCVVSRDKSSCRKLHFVVARSCALAISARAKGLTCVPPWPKYLGYAVANLSYGWVEELIDFCRNSCRAPGRCTGAENEVSIVAIRLSRALHRPQSPGTIDFASILSQSG